MSPISSRPKDMRSPFLALAGELRNKIYEEALHHDRMHGKLANVALLRVNKQINDEAKDLIYDNSAFSITVSAPWPPSKPPLFIPGHRETSTESLGRAQIQPATTRSKLEISGDMNHAFITDKKYPGPEQIYDALSLSTKMLKFKRLNVLIRPRCLLATTCFIYALACLLNTPGACTEELHVTVDYVDYKHKSGESRPAIWYGLAKMPSHLSIHVSGDPCHDCFFRYLVLKDNRPHPMRPPATACNTIAMWKRIKEPPRRELAKVLSSLRDQVPWTPIPLPLTYLSQRLDYMLHLFRDGTLADGRTFDVDLDLAIVTEMKCIEKWIDCVVAGKQIGQSDEDKQAFSHSLFTDFEDGLAQTDAWYKKARKEFQEAAEARQKAENEIWN